MKKLTRQKRIFFIILAFMVLYSIHGYQLFQLQIISGSRLTKEAVQQRSSSLTLNFSRGEILDRDGKSLLNHELKEVLVAFPFIYRENKEEIHQAISSFKVINRLEENYYNHHPFIVKKDSELPSHKKELISYGLVPSQIKIRYGSDSLAQHTIGYLNLAEGTGVAGIEKLYDEYISGDIPTRLSAIVDGRNNFIEGLGYRLQDSSGRETPKNVVLTLDHSLQKAVEEIMDNNIEKGAVVVADPNTGDLLALASRPTFDPYNLVESFQMDGEPMINRAVTNFQPGSVFKTVLAVAAFEENKVSLYDTLLDGTTLVDAFAHSCNNTFIELAEMIGWEKIRSYAVSLGLGQKTGWPLQESKGLLPGDSLSSGSIANKAIGQGKVETTPLQVARMMSVIASGGELRQFRLVKRVEDHEGRIIVYNSTDPGDQIINNSTANQLKYMLQAVTTRGTGAEAALSNISVGGKTGTAQSGRLHHGEKVTYYWFAGMAPLEKSEAVIVVFMEEPGAPEVFREVSRAFFENN